MAVKSFCICFKEYSLHFHAYIYANSTIWFWYLTKSKTKYSSALLRCHFDGTAITLHLGTSLTTTRKLDMTWRTVDYECVCTANN